MLAPTRSRWGSLCRAVTGIQWAGERGKGKRGTGKRPPFPIPLSLFPPALSAQIATDRTGLAVLSHDIPLSRALVRHSGPENVYAELGRARSGTQ